MSDTTGNGNFLGMSPGFAQNLLNFGASTMMAANARTPQGFLQYGGGALGPLGAGLMGMQQQNMDIAKLRGALGLQQAETEKTRAETSLTNAQVPFLQQSMGLAQQAMDPNFGMGGMDSSGGFAGNTSGVRAPANVIPPEQREQMVRDAVKGTDVPANVLDALTAHESGWDANARGGKGEIGLTQTMPDTAHNPGYGVPSIDPSALTVGQNSLKFGAQYLQWIANNYGMKPEDWNNPTKLAQVLHDYNGQQAPASYAQDIISRTHQAPSWAPKPYQIAQNGGGMPPMPGQAPLQINIQGQGQQMPGGFQGMDPQSAMMRANQLFNIARGMNGPMLQGARESMLAQAKAYWDYAQTGPKAMAEQQAQVWGAGPKAMAEQGARAAYAGPIAEAEQGARAKYAGQIAGEEAGAKYPYDVAAAQAKAETEQAARAKYAGQIAGVEAGARFPYQINTVRPGGAIFQGGQPIGSVPLQSPEVVLSGPNAGVHTNVFRDPLTGEIKGGGAGTGENGLPPGAVPTALSPQQEGMLKAQPEVIKQNIEHDRTTVEGDLSHVLDNVVPAKQQLFQLRGLIDQAAPGAGGQLRADFKNWVQTFAPDFVSQVTGNASPAQEFNKIALMGAGKQERGDLGARGGFRAIEMYVKANPNLDMQPTANRDMANALLVSHQYHEDYASGASNWYTQNLNGFMTPNNPQAYKPISQYDQKFIQTMRPELYASAISAMNGKPYAEWSKGLTGKQLQLVGGILQRTDPNATIDIGHGMVPVSKFKTTMGPNDIVGGE